METARYERLRDVALVALDQYYCPLTLDELAAVVRQLGVQDVTPVELEELVGLEERAFDAGLDRAVWICWALEPPDFYPDTDFVCRSDWRPGERIVQFELERERRMWVLRRVSDHVLGCLEERGDPTPLAEVFAGLLAGVPGDVLRERVGTATVDVHDEDAVDAVRELAEDLHADLAVGPRRHDLAAGISQLDRRASVFGRQDE